MSTCATCCHWVKPQTEGWNGTIRLALLPGETEDDRYDDDSAYTARQVAAEQAFRVCQKIDLLDSYDVVETLPLAFTRDGSGYRADLYTRAEFGCLAHEPAT